MFRKLSNRVLITRLARFVHESQIKSFLYGGNRRFLSGSTVQSNEKVVNIPKNSQLFPDKDDDFAEESHKKMKDPSDLLDYFKTLHHLGLESDKQLIKLALYDISQNEHSFKNLKDITEILTRLLAEDFYARQKEGLKEFLQTVFSALKKQSSERIEPLLFLNILTLASDLSYKYPDQSFSHQIILKDVIELFPIHYLSKDFHLYTTFLMVLTTMKIPWNKLSETKRKTLLSYLQGYEQNSKNHNKPLSFQDKERLIYCFEDLQILSNSFQELTENNTNPEHITFYGDLLNEMISNEDYLQHKLPVTYAIFKQLRELSVYTKSNIKTKKNIPLLQRVYKGLENEWTFKEMDISKKCLTFFLLSDLAINYKTIPTSLWQKMVTDITDNMIRVRSHNRSLLLKGWLGLGFEWKDMNNTLRLSLLQTATERWKTDDIERSQAITLFYLGDLGMKQNTKYLKEEVMNKLMERIALTCIHYEGRGLINILLGLAKMKIGWNSMSPLLQKSLLQAIGNKYRHFTIDEISDLFLSYGKLEMNIYFLPGAIIKSIEDMIHKAEKMDHTSKHIASIVYGLSRMGCPWESLELSTENSLLMMIGNSIPNTKPQDLVTIMYSLALMSYQSAEYEKAYFIPLHKALLRHYNQFMKKQKNSNKDIFTIEEQRHVAKYKEWLKSLPVAKALEL